MAGRFYATTSVAALLAIVDLANCACAQTIQTPQNPSAAAAATGPDKAIQLDTITVTATKTAEPVIDTLGGVSSVGRSEIERIQPNTISDVLRNVPGVFMQESLNDPGQSINIRGLQDFGRVNVLVDGARQDFQISGHNANGTFYLDPEFLGQADVVRGPIANIYGSGAIGGVVSFRTRGIDDILYPDEKMGFAQRIGFGTNGAGFLTSTAAGARLGTAADVYGQLVYRPTSSYRDGAGDKVPDTGSDLVGGLMKVNVRPADGHQISATALTQKYDFTNNGTSAAGTRFRTDAKTSIYTLGYTFARPDVPVLALDLKAYYTQTDFSQNVVAPSATYASLGVTPGNSLSDKIATYGFDAHNTSLFDTGPVSHKLTIGGDSAWDRVRTADVAGGFVSALTPTGNRNIAGAFVQDEARFGWLRVLGALRYDSYSLNGGGFSSSGDRVSPKITVGVSPIQGVEFYGTYAEGYRAPAITETLISGTHPFPAFQLLANPAVRPETAHNLEAGVNIKYDNVFQQTDSFRAKAAIFTNTVDDYIDLTPVGPTYFVPFSPAFPAASCSATPRPFYCVIPITSYQYVNIAKARLEGAEIEAAYDWGGGFVSVSGSHVNGRNQTTGGALATVPPDRVSGTLGFRFFERALTISSRLRLVSDSNSSSVITTPTNGYGLVDLFASYKYSENISADLSVTNLFNRQYVQYLDTLASPGLTAKFGVTIKFASR